jgi:hypothetical protein
MDRRILLSLSFAIAALSASARWITSNFVLPSAVLAVLWFVVFVISLRRHGKYSCWILLGAPLALYWPIMFALTVLGCIIGNADCG